MIFNFNAPYLSEDSDLLEFRVTEFGLAPRTRKRSKKRVRKVTLTQAIKQARKAGITAGTISIDGVTLEYGNQIDATDNALDSWMKRHAN